MGFFYGVTDIFTTSYAEGERNKYRELVSFLDGKITNISTSIEYVNGEIAKIHETAQCEQDSAFGTINLVFCSEEENWKVLAYWVMGKLQDALADIEDKRSEAQGKVDYWQREVELEDQRRKEYEREEEERRRQEEAKLQEKKKSVKK